jgi:hypothetical protein
MAARSTNTDIVGANDFAFANNPGHYRGQPAAKLAKEHIVRYAVSVRPTTDPHARITPLTNHID